MRVTLIITVKHTRNTMYMNCVHVIDFFYKQNNITLIKQYYRKTIDSNT